MHNITQPRKYLPYKTFPILTGVNLLKRGAIKTG